MTLTRNCVIVSPYFPPSTLAGVHRARHLAKHLPSVGWNPIVLCVDERFHEQRLDPSLATLVPNTTEIVKVEALSARVSRSLGIGDLSLRAFLPLRRALHRLLRERPVAVVLITGSPYYPMLFASEVRERFGIPVVLDFQDPWVSAWGAAQPRFSKAGASHALATRLEPRALRSASFITSVSEVQNTQLARRYGWLERDRMAAIPIGCDPEDFAATPSGTGARSWEPEPGCFNFSYVGTIWPAVLPTVRVFLQALARLRSLMPAAFERLRFHFVGTSGNPSETSGCRVRPIADGLGLSDVVFELPQRLPYLEGLSVVRRSDANLILGSAEPHYTASKVFPVLMSGRPYLSLLHDESSAHQILESAGGGIALGFSTPDGPERLQDRVSAAVASISSDPQHVGKADPVAYRPYEAAGLAERYGRIFHRLDGSRDELECA